MKKLLGMKAAVLMVFLALCGIAAADDIPVPEFSFPATFKAGQPIVVTFPDGLTDDLGAQVVVINLENDNTECAYSIYYFNLDDNNSFVVIDEGLDAGEYRADVRGIQTTPLQSDENVSSVTFTVTGTRPEVPEVEIISNNASWRGENEIRITSPGITGFILNAYDSEERMSWSTLSTDDQDDQAAMTWIQESENVISVRLNRKRSNTTDNWYTVAAVVDGIASRFTEDAVHLTWQAEEKDPAPEIEIAETFRAGQPVIVTVPDGIPANRELEMDVFRGSDTDYLSIIYQSISSYSLDENNCYVLFPNGLDAGDYWMETYFCEYDDGDWYYGQRITIRFTVEEAETDGEISISVSDEELYTGNMVTVTASSHQAEKIRIYLKEEYAAAEIVKEAEGTSCEYSVQYNMEASLKFWAEACYDGAWSDIYSEVKNVSFISMGTLDAPTFACSTRFKPEETITVTRTNYVENEETCMLFLSTQDHSETLINGKKFNGEDTLSITAPDEPGKYILSVLVMAPGWNNNQTDLIITVSEGSYEWTEDENIEVVDIDNLDLDSISSEFQAGENEYNPGSVGTILINYVLNGPSDLTELRIGSWGTVQPDKAKIEEDIEFYARIWKSSYSSPSGVTFPYRAGNGMPVDEEFLGKDLYVLLIGLDQDCNAIGYLVARVTVPGTNENSIKFSEYTMYHINKWTNAPLYLPAGDLDGYGWPIFLYTEDWTQISSASVEWVSGDENLMDLFEVRPNYGLSNYLLEVKTYNGTGMATYHLSATSDSGTAELTFTVMVAEMPENGVPKQLKDTLYVPINKTVNLSSVGIMYNPESYTEEYYISGDDFLCIEHEYEDEDGKRFTLKEDGTFTAQEAVIYNARFDVMPGANLRGMFDFTIVVYEADFTLPSNLKEIEAEAFQNISADYIRIPESVESISPDAFDSDVKLIIKEGSQWENWAEGHGYKVIIEE